MKHINYKASALVKAGINSVMTFGKVLSKSAQVRMLKKYRQGGITVYFNDGDWMVYRIK